MLKIRNNLPNLTATVGYLVVLQLGFGVLCRFFKIDTDRLRSRFVVAFRAQRELELHIYGAWRKNLIFLKNIF